MVKFRAAAFIIGSIALAAWNARAHGEEWKYTGVPLEERIAETESKKVDIAGRKTKPKNRKQEYQIKIKFMRPEIQTRDTVAAVPIEETKRKEIPFWFGISLLGLGALGITCAGISIAYKIKNRKFENNEPAAIFPKNYSGKFPEYLPIELYVYYPYKLKATISSVLVAAGIAGAYFLSHSSETTKKIVQQTAQVVVEPVPFSMEKDSFGTYFIVNTKAGWDSTLSYLQEIDTAKKDIKIIFFGNDSNKTFFYELRSIFPKSEISIQ